VAGQAQDCYTLGKSYAAGQDGEEPDRRAADAHKKACELGLAKGCLDLAAMHRTGDGIAKDILRAVELMKRACDLKDAEGCGLLGDLYESRAEVPVSLGESPSTMRSPVTAGAAAAAAGSCGCISIMCRCHATRQGSRVFGQGMRGQRFGFVRSLADLLWRADGVAADRPGPSRYFERRAMAGPP